MLPTEEVWRRLPEFDFFVLPSWREGVPRSIIEAMASGLPVVTTDIRGCRELVTDDMDGWLVPRRDPHRLSQVLSQVQTLPAPELERRAKGSIPDGGRESPRRGRLRSPSRRVPWTRLEDVTSVSRSWGGCGIGSAPA